MLDKNTELMIKSPQFHTDFWNYLRQPSPITESKIPKQAKLSILGSAIMPTKSIEKLRDKLTTFSPLRQLCTTMTLDKSHHTIFHYISEPKTMWTDENGYPIHEELDSLTAVQTKIDSHLLASFVRVSNTLKDDMSFELEDYLTTVFAKAFVKEESKAFIHGDGATMPAGLLHETKGATVGHKTSALTFEALLSLYISVDSEYRTNGTWIMSDDTFMKLKLLTDKDGNRVWKDDLLFNKPVVIVNAMNQSTYPIAFGDFSSFWIMERFAPTVKVLRELIYMKDQTGYLGYQTLDTLLTNQNAIKLLKVEG